MNKQEARRVASAARDRFQIPKSARLEAVEQVYIELAGEDPTQPAPVRDVLVWLARFRLGSGWRELAIEDATARVVRTRNSRGWRLDQKRESKDGSFAT